MLSGNIHENSNLKLLPEPLQRAVRFLKENDLAAHEPGRFSLDGDRMILQVLDLSTSPRESLRPEVHRKYIDVQFLAAGGPERIGWYPDLKDNETDEDLLDTPRDICFYKNDPAKREGIIEMQPGSYAMFFPWDVHIPAIQAGKSAPIRKIVIKVALDSCL
jgi:YhcH/YjgK/YiaL family protein